MEPSRRAVRHVWPVGCLGPLTFVSVIFKYLLEAESAACHSFRPFFFFFPNTRRREPAPGSDRERGRLVYRTGIAVKIPLHESSARSLARTPALCLPPFQSNETLTGLCIRGFLAVAVFIERIGQSAGFADDRTAHPHGVHPTLGSLFTLLALYVSKQPALTTP